MGIRLGTIALMTILMTGISFSGHTQVNGDSILANERTIDRPLNVHQGQLRMTMEYDLMVNSTQFDDRGNSLDLSEQGLTNIGHALLLEVNYGFFEFLQASVRLRHLQEGQRERSTTIIAPPGDPINITQVTERTGWSDLDLSLGFKVPFYTQQYDFVFTLGHSLPTSAHEPGEPGHTIENQAGFQTITYRFRERTGSGVRSWLLGLQGKIRGDRLAFSANANFRVYAGEGTSIAWSGRLNQGDITYTHRPYAFQLGEEMGLQLVVEYQVFSFFTLFSGYASERVSEGWSGVTGRRVLVPSQQLSTVHLGAEVLATPRFWINQQVSMPLSGQNRLVPLTFSTRILYNLFPFQ